MALDKEKKYKCILIHVAKGKCKRTQILIVLEMRSIWGYNVGSTVSTARAESRPYISFNDDNELVVR